MGSDSLGQRGQCNANAQLWCGYMMMLVAIEISLSFSKARMYDHMCIHENAWAASELTAKF